MNDINYKIILPTNTKYLDVTKNYIELLKINWPEAYEHLVLSLTGPVNNELEFFNEFPIVRNNEFDSLPTCVLNAASEYKADYYFIFLGDAFIFKRVNNDSVKDLLRSLIVNNIDYCRLLPQLHTNIGHFGKYYRNICTDERYSHSFVAFGASFQFIRSEFSNNITDRDFEIKYLKLANKKKHSYFESRVILRKNIFCIMPSIQKGKWDRVNLAYLKRKYPEIVFSDRNIISWKYELIIKIRKIVLPVIPKKIRITLKKKNSKYFDTDL